MFVGENTPTSIDPTTFRFGDAVRSCPLIAFIGASPSSPTTLPRLAPTIATHGDNTLEGVGVGSRHSEPAIDITERGVAPVAFHARPWHTHALGADPLPTLGFAIHRTAHVFVSVQRSNRSAGRVEGGMRGVEVKHTGVCCHAFDHIVIDRKRITCQPQRPSPLPLAPYNPTTIC
jgi:hypothetical protein